MREERGELMDYFDQLLLFGCNSEKKTKMFYNNLTQAGYFNNSGLTRTIAADENRIIVVSIFVTFRRYHLC